MVVFDSKNFPYEIRDGAISVSHENAKLLKEEDIVPSSTVSVNMLNLILESDDMFNYAILVFSGNLKCFQILENAGSDYELRSFTSKKIMYRAFVEAIRIDKIKLTDETRKRFHILKEMMFITYYEDCHVNDIYEIDIEGEKYKFKVGDFFSLIRYDNLELVKLLNDESEICGVKKEYFIYALKSYFSSNYLASRYEFPALMDKNYKSILTDTYVDTYAVNVSYVDEELADKVKLNPELEKYIMSGIKDDFSLIEKCVYIYLKLCKVLTYDEEFYAAHQEGKPAEKHKNIEHISEISLINNSVVCYEFSKIYACFLKKLGIQSNSFSSPSYGSGHDNVEFRCEKFVVLADAVASIFSGDMFNVKLNKKPVNLVCLNKNADTQVEFNKALERMVEYVKCEEQEEYQESLKTYSIEDLLASYHNFTDNYKEIPLNDRIDILLEKVNSVHVLKGIDVYSYVKSLGGRCFSEAERTHNINFEIVRNNYVKEEDKEVLPIGILVVNPDGFAEDHYKNNYYTFTPEDGLKQISYYTLKEYFEKSVFEYIDPRRDTKIPGIERGIHK